MKPQIVRRVVMVLAIVAAATLLGAGGAGHTYSQVFQFTNGTDAAITATITAGIGGQTLSHSFEVSANSTGSTTLTATGLSCGAHAAWYQWHNESVPTHVTVTIDPAWSGWTYHGDAAGHTGTRTCTVCDASETAPAAPHHWGAWGPYASAGASGHVRSRSCTVCGYEETEAAEHAWGDWDSAGLIRSCTVCGHPDVAGGALAAELAGELEDDGTVGEAETTTEAVAAVLADELEEASAAEITQTAEDAAASDPTDELLAEALELFDEGPDVEAAISEVDLDADAIQHAETGDTDPVFLQTGQLIAEASGLSVSYFQTEVAVSRHYMSGASAAGIFGTGWVSNLDARVLLGIDTTSAEREQQLRALRDELVQVESQLQLVVDECTEQIEERSAAATELRAAAAALSAAAVDIRDDALAIDNEPIADTARAFITRAGEHLAWVTRVERTLRHAETVVAELGERIVSTQAARVRVAMLLASLADVVVANEAAVAHNATAALPGEPAARVTTGLGTVNLVDESGAVHRYAALCEPSELITTLARGIGAHMPVGRAISRDRHQIDEAALGAPQIMLHAARVGSPELWVTSRGYLVARWSDRSLVVFAGDGLLVGWADAHGNYVAVDRDGGDRRITGIHDAAGRAWELDTGDDRLLRSVEGPAGMPESVTYRYEYEAGMLVAAVSTTGARTGYAYQNRLLAQITEPDGASRHYEYTQIGGRPCVTVTTNETGGRETITYNQARRTVMHRNPSGVLTSYVYNERLQITSMTIGADSPIAATTSFEYGEHGNRTAIIDPRGARTSFDYDQAGYLTRRTDPDGRTVGLTYDSTHRLTTATDRSGLTTQYRWDGETVTEVRHPDGAVERFDYGDAGELLGHTDAVGNRTRFAYDRYGGLTDQWTPGGSHTQWRRDVLSRVVRIVDPCGFTTDLSWRPDGLLDAGADADGRILDLEYDSAGRVTSVHGWDGLVTSFTYDPAGRLLSSRDQIGPRVSYTYRADGKPIARTDGGIATTEFVYDALGRIAAVTGPTPEAIVRYEYDAASNRTAITDPDGGRWQYQYDALSRVTAVIDPLGGVTRLAYSAGPDPISVTDPLGRTTTRSYDPRGNLIGETLPDGVTRRYGYDGRGLRVLAVDEMGDQQSYRYSADQLLIATGFPDGSERRFEYDACGRVVAAIDQRGARTTWSYDQRGNVVEQTDPGGHRTQFRYDDADRLIRQIDAEGGARTYEYDHRGRVVLATDECGEVRRYVYDMLDRPTSIVDALGRERRFTYDAAGRPLTHEVPGGLLTTYRYSASGKLTERTDPGGLVHTWEYDAAGRLAAMVRPGGARESYRYDAVGNLLAQVRPGRSERSFTYDRRDRLIEYEDATGAVTEYDYRADRLVAAVRSPAGAISYRYDALDRLTSAVFDRSQRIDYGYDVAGRLTSLADGEGSIQISYSDCDEVIRVWEPERRVEQRFTYDALHRRIASEIRYPDGTTTTERRSYDAAGRCTELHTPAGTVSYEFDALGRETKRTHPNGLVTATAFTDSGAVAMTTHRLNTGRGASRLLDAEAHLYDQAGRRRLTIDEQGRVTAYDYDDAGRIAKARYPFDTTVASAHRERTAAFIDERQLPSAPGRPALGAILTDGGEPYVDQLGLHANDHDAAQRLLAAMGAFGVSVDPQQPVWSERFEYDDRDNRTCWATGWGPVGYTYDAEDRLLFAGDRRYDYDGAGRLVSSASERRSATYSYSPRGFLTRADVVEQDPRTAERTEHTALFAYDSTGRRRESTSDTTVTHTVYDGLSRTPAATVPCAAGAAVAARSPSSGGARGFAIAPERPDSLTPITSPRPVYREATHMVSGDGTARGRYNDNGAVWFVTDHLDHRRMVVDEHQQPIARVDYDLFGNVLAEVTEPSVVGYNGQPMSPVDGHYTYAFRDYDPATGRFSTPDPLRVGANWYSYRDPLNTIDPLGLCPEPAASESWFDSWLPTVESIATGLVPDLADLTPEPATPLAQFEEYMSQNELAYASGYFDWETAPYGGSEHLVKYTTHGGTPRRVYHDYDYTSGFFSYVGSDVISDEELIAEIEDYPTGPNGLPGYHTCNVATSVASTLSGAANLYTFQGVQYTPRQIRENLNAELYNGEWGEYVPATDSDAIAEALTDGKLVIAVGDGHIATVSSPSTVWNVGAVGIGEMDIGHAFFRAREVPAGSIDYWIAEVR